MFYQLIIVVLCSVPNRPSHEELEIFKIKKINRLHQCVNYLLSAGKQGLFEFKVTSGFYYGFPMTSGAS